jgi:hypothetical protein
MAGGNMSLSDGSALEKEMCLCLSPAVHSNSECPVHREQESESDKRYMKDPMSKTVEGFINGLHILSRYMEADLGTKFFFGAEHDIVYIYTDGNPSQLTSDGLRLSELGFHWDKDTEQWAYYT